MQAGHETTLSLGMRLDYSKTCHNPVSTLYRLSGTIRTMWVVVLLDVPQLILVLDSNLGMQYCSYATLDQGKFQIFNCS